jgi:ubiquinone/menaquinone biosynthesis C-methylase UbiE
MPSSYTATDARAYEHLMGRWSTRLAKELIGFAGVETGDRVLDVGCGTGSMALQLAARPEPIRIAGIDIAAPYIAYASTRSADPRLVFLTGDAIALNLPAGSFDRAFRCLLLTSCRILPGSSRACAGSRVRAA